MLKTANITKTWLKRIRRYQTPTSPKGKYLQTKWNVAKYNTEADYGVIDTQNYIKNDQNAYMHIFRVW